MESLQFYWKQIRAALNSLFQYISDKIQVLEIVINFGRMSELNEHLSLASFDLKRCANRFESNYMRIEPILQWNTIQCRILSAMPLESRFCRYLKRIS